jgi:hypothetical protein
MYVVRDQLELDGTLIENVCRADHRLQGHGHLVPCRSADATHGRYRWKDVLDPCGWQRQYRDDLSGVSRTICDV